MRTRLIGLAVSLSILGLAAASLAGAAPPGGGSSTGAVGGGHGGGGSSSGSGSRGGGFSGGGHFVGGHGGGGGGVFYSARSGAVAHGDYSFRLVGYQSAGMARGGAVSHATGGTGGTRLELAFGPRMGSAATAARVSPVSRIDRINPPHQGPHPRPKAPQHRYAPVPSNDYSGYFEQPPVFCSFAVSRQNRVQNLGCPQASKTEIKIKPR